MYFIVVELKTKEKKKHISNMPDGQKKLDRPVIRSKENLWLELRKAREKISVEILTLRQREACCRRHRCRRWTHQNDPDTKKKQNKTKPHQDSLCLMFVALGSTVSGLGSCSGGAKVPVSDLLRVRSVAEASTVYVPAAVALPGF